MGDSQVWIGWEGSVPTFAELFVVDEFRADALEAVKLLKPGIDHEHVRKLLWEAKRQNEIRLLWTNYPRETKRLLDATELIIASVRPARPA